ncbi:MAG: helix-turn-helix domain-containing protein [Lachnospiraceae bacterium]|nr:helix-turn-helix domain-containing protein [Lachnospiraceae bacterium]
MKNTIHLSIYDTEQISNIAKALSSEQRLKILKLLDNNVLNISEVAARLQMPMSSAALHIKILEESGLVITQPVPGIRGSQKLSGIKVDHLSIDLKPSYHTDSPFQTAYFSMPIGNYFDFGITPPCGIVSESRYLGAADDASAFFQPEHSMAQLIWFTQGYLEYRFNNRLLKTAKTVEGIEFSFEACSEAQGYNNEWPSDITLWVGGKEVGTFTSEGDFGGIRGQQNPVWWSDTLTQYGILHRLFIDHSGCYIDGMKTSGETLDSLPVGQNDYLTFRIGIKKDAKYVGGLNLFGERFGNYSQHINMKIDYTQ